MTAVQASTPVSDPVGGPMVPAPYRVVERQQDLADTVTLALEPLESPMPPFEAGQFTMLYAFGVGEVPISVSGDPTDSRALRHTIRSVGAVTEVLCGLEAGDVVGLRGPYGNGWRVTDASGGDVVLVAGGIGLAPLRSALHQILSERDRYERVNLLVGARSPSELLFRDELTAWRGRFDLEVEVTVDTAPPDWRGEVGVVTSLLDREPFDDSNVTAFVCGPEIMMRFAAGALTARGVTADRIRVSLERNMKCAIAQCGHCQLGGTFVCREGPVFGWDEAGSLLAVRGR